MKAFQVSRDGPPRWAWRVALAALGGGLALAAGTWPVQGADAPVAAPAERQYSAEQWVRLGIMRNREKDLAGSRQAFEQALAVDPLCREARFNLGLLYIENGQSAAARDLLEPMLNSNPTNAALLNNLAWMYATATDPQVRNAAEAIDLARQALLLTPEDYHVWHTLAEAYYTSARYEKALRIAETALLLVSQAKPLPSPSASAAYRQMVEKCQQAIAAFSIVE